MPIAIFDIDASGRHQHVDTTVGGNDALGHIGNGIFIRHIEHFDTGGASAFCCHFFELGHASAGQHHMHTGFR